LQLALRTWRKTGRLRACTGQVEVTGRRAGQRRRLQYEIGLTAVGQDDRLQRRSGRLDGGSKADTSA
jgi:hypothetical protein